MRPLILKCPSCATDLAVSRLHCHTCEITIDGDFGLPALLRLNRAQLDFVEVFLKNRGNIREVERELGVSYPTVRARLDEVLDAIGLNLSSRSAARVDEPRAEDPNTRTRRAVLEQLSAGTISPEDAMRLLSASGKPTKSESEDPDHG